MKFYLCLLCLILLELPKSFYAFLQSRPIRQYPQYWVQTTNYTYNYLKSNNSIRDKGSDLLALSSILLSMGYDNMYPPQLNAYIIQHNGTYDNGNDIITYFSGNVINWQGFKNFGLQYQGQYNNPSQFLQLSGYINSNIDDFGVLAIIRDQYLIDGVIFPESQYVHVHTVQHYRSQLLVYNANSPQNIRINQNQVFKYIVFKKTQTGPNTLSCTDTIILNGDGAQCLAVVPSSIFGCIKYIRISSTTLQCIQCRQRYYLNALNTCSSCPIQCYNCRLGFDGQIQCLKCAYNYMKSQVGCIFNQIWCKQVYYTAAGVIQCSQCYDGAYSHSPYQTQNACMICGGDRSCYKCSSYSVCIECYPPYTLVNGGCQLDPSINFAENCKTRHPYFSTCTVCQQSFDNINGLCIDCQSEYANHEACHDSYRLRCQEYFFHACLKCKQGYRLTQGSIPKCIYDPYQKCFIGSGYQNPGCNYCQRGYYLNSSRVCVPCQNGYTLYESPFQCFQCQPPSNDINNQCKVMYYDQRCICSGDVLHFIIQIQAQNAQDFFISSTYRQSKLFGGFADYLNTDWFSLKTLNFEYIKNGDQVFYVFVGYIYLTVTDFERQTKLQAIEQKLKRVIFDFETFTIMSVYTKIGPLNPKYEKELSHELVQVEEQQQQSITNELIMFCVFGGAMLYIGLVFCCNYYKNVVKECSKKQQSEVQSEKTLRQLKTRKQSTQFQKQDILDSFQNKNQMKKQSKKKTKKTKYIMDIIQMNDDN